MMETTAFLRSSWWCLCSSLLKNIELFFLIKKNIELETNKNETFVEKSRVEFDDKRVDVDVVSRLKYTKISRCLRLLVTCCNRLFSLINTAVYFC